MAFCVSFYGMIWFQKFYLKFNPVSKVVLEVAVIVDHLLFLSLRRFFRTSLRTVDALALLSKKIFIVGTLEFLLSSLVFGLIWELVVILTRGFGGKVT